MLVVSATATAGGKCDICVEHGGLRRDRYCVDSMKDLVKNNQRYDHLDGWRGLAIIFLLIGHFYPVPGINFGHFGVNLFFVLSGLLMSRLLFVKSIPIRLFYKRRISRIFPAFYTFLAVVVCIFSLTDTSIDWPEVSMAAIFLSNYFQGEIGHAVMPFGHVWSLSVEEHSYILLSLIAVAVRRRWCHPMHGIAFFTGIFAMVGVWYWLIFSGSKLGFQMWYHSEVSAYGIFVSAFFLLLFGERKIPELPAITYPALALIGMGLHWWSVPFPIMMIFGVGALALLINLLAQAPKAIKSALSFYPLRKFGIWSFSIYLWQQPFYLAHSRHDMPSWIACTLAVAAGIGSYYLLEKPARNYLNKRWAKEVQIDAACAAAHAA